VKTPAGGRSTAWLGYPAISVSPMPHVAVDFSKVNIYLSFDLSIPLSRSTQPRPRAFNYCPPPCSRYPAPTFCSLTALPFNSDFDGNMGLFACIRCQATPYSTPYPRLGARPYRPSRIAPRRAIPSRVRRICYALRSGTARTVCFVAVESM
jgi:hypothetical protein